MVPGAASNAQYIIARDLLDHRHIHTLVISDEGPIGMPHFQASHWFLMGQNTEALAGLAFSGQARLYGEAVLGMPRQLFESGSPQFARRPPPCKATLFGTRTYHAPNIAANFGISPVGWPGFSTVAGFCFFQAGRRQLRPDETQVYSAADAGAFAFTGPPTEPNALHFVRKLAQLCQERGTQLVILQTPFTDQRARKN